MNPESLRSLPFFRNATFCWVVARPNSMLSVRSQGNTKCCYAFVIVDLMFSKQVLDNHRATKGSEQELLDLLHLIYPHETAKYDTNNRIIADERGLPNSYINAYNYILDFGLSLEINYPFVGKCIPRTWPADRPRSIYMGPTNEELEAMRRGYCKFEYHAILVVGYGYEGTQPYYIIKNLWGEDWGYMGYAKINPALTDVFNRTSCPNTPFLLPPN